MNSKSTLEYYTKVNETVQFLKEQLGTAEVGLVLGSGLNDFTKELQNSKELSYSQVPNLPQTTVKGHQGKFVIGELGNKRVLCLAGRVHGYEGLQMFELTFMARVLGMLGVKLFIATNASGGCAKGMYPGCLMIIRDHINFYHRNPLTDTAELLAQLGQRYPHFSNLYSSRLAEVARTVAKTCNLRLFEGIYGATSGPCYETPQEVKSFSLLGASAFGMSTIPETMTAKCMGMEVFAISLITNLAAGMTEQVLTHKDVTHVAQNSAEEFIAFMKKFVAELTVIDRAPLPNSFPISRPLPITQFSPVPQSEMDQVCKFIQEQIHESPSVIVCLAEIHESFLSNLSDVKTFSLSSLSHFPKMGPNEKAILSFGKLDHQVIGVLSQITLEGFHCEEATYLSDLFYGLGVKKLIHSFSLGSTASSHSIGSFVFLEDAFDSTTIHPYSHNVPVHQYNLNFKLFEKADFLSIPSASYGFFPGPSFPTPAEVNLAKFANFTTVGQSSLALLFASRFRKINVLAIGEITYVEQPTSTSLYISSKEKVFELLSKSIFHPISNDSSSTASSSLVTFPSKSKQVSYQLPHPISVGNYDKTQKAKTFVQKSISETSTLALVIDQAFFHQLFNKVEIKGEVALKDILHLEEFPVTLSLVLIGGANIWLLRGTVYANQGYSYDEITFGIRLLHALGVLSILFVSPIFAVDPQIQQGELCIASDHVMLSGRNPLFGANEEKWGERFTDLSRVYSASWKQDLMDMAKKMQIACHSFLYAHVIGPVICSELINEFTRKLGLGGFCTGMAPEIVIARHMGLEVGFLGVSNYVSYKEQSSSTDKVPAYLEEFLSKILSLHKVIELKH